MANFQALRIRNLGLIVKHRECAPKCCCSVIQAAVVSPTSQGLSVCFTNPVEADNDHYPQANAWPAAHSLLFGSCYTLPHVADPHMVCYIERGEISGDLGYTIGKSDFRRCTNTSTSAVMVDKESQAAIREQSDLLLLNVQARP